MTAEEARKRKAYALDTLSKQLLTGVLAQIEEAADKGFDQIKEFTPTTDSGCSAAVQDAVDKELCAMGYEVRHCLDDLRYWTILW